jgi:hypothetical protein
MRRLLRSLAIASLSMAALVSAAELAQARDGCGPGRFYNGYRCVPMGGYGGGYYDDGPRYYRPAPPPMYYGGGPRYGGGGSIYIDPNGRPQCRQRGFTVQDGVCKPYRGY